MRDIIAVKYQDRLKPNLFSGREYTYYADIDLKVGDIVIAPTKYGNSKAQVTKINIPEEKIESFKDAVKTITKKLEEGI